MTGFVETDVTIAAKSDSDVVFDTDIEVDGCDVSDKENEFGEGIHFL